MPTPKKDTKKLGQLLRLLKRPKTIEQLMVKTNMTQASIYRYLQEIAKYAHLVRHNGRPVKYQIIPDVGGE